MRDLTNEDLAGLPVGSVIYCESLGKTASKQYTSDDGRVTSFLVGVYPFFQAATVFESQGPFRLVYRPDPELVEEYERFSLECAELRGDLAENLNDHREVVARHSKKSRAGNGGKYA